MSDNIGEVTRSMADNKRDVTRLIAENKRDVTRSMGDNKCDVTRSVIDNMNGPQTDLARDTERRDSVLEKTFIGSKRKHNHNVILATLLNEMIIISEQEEPESSVGLLPPTLYDKIVPDVEIQNTWRNQNTSYKTGESSFRSTRTSFSLDEDSALRKLDSQIYLRSRTKLFSYPSVQYQHGALS